MELTHTGEQSGGNRHHLTYDPSDRAVVFWPRKDSTNEAIRILRQTESELQHATKLKTSSRRALEHAATQLQADIAQLYRLLGQVSNLLATIEEVPAEVPEIEWERCRLCAAAG